MTYSIDSVAARAAFLTNEDMLVNVFAVVFLVALCYSVGRLHEFTRRVSERENAFADGYNLATKSLFSLATRATKGMTIERNKPVTPIRGAAAVSRKGKGEPPTEVVRDLPGVGDTAVQPLGARHAARRGKSTMQERQGRNFWRESKKAS